MSVASKRHLRAERNCVLNVCCHPPNVKPKVLSTQLYNTQGRQHTHNPMPSAAQRHSGIYPSKAKGGKSITIHVKLGEGEAMWTTFNHRPKLIVRSRLINLSTQNKYCAADSVLFIFLFAITKIDEFGNVFFFFFFLFILSFGMWCGARGAVRFLQSVLFTY